MGLKEKIDNAPNSAGVYFFKDIDARPIYIGKAASIRKRLKSHFAKDVSGRQKALVDNTCDLDYIITPDEASALLLEAALVKQYSPKYNVALRDDKAYPRLKLTINEDYPKLFITRRLKDDGALYFGPYTNAKLLRKALMSMKRIFPLRTCRVLGKKECLNFHIKQCLSPCIGACKREDYLKVVEDVKLFLEGKRDKLISSFSAQMRQASDSKDYETAALIRDRMQALSHITDATQKMDKPGPSGLNKKARIYPTEQLEGLRSILKLPKVPSIIEAFDVSNIGGKEAVGSMVSFVNGMPNKDEYLRFKIKTVKTIDDYSMMREIVSRRYRRLIAEGAGLPDLIIIDGGKAHLTAAKKELRRLGLWDIPAVGIAKRFERLYISEQKEPIALGKFRNALYLVQRIRDEAHRFAIGYHRLLRRRETAVSDLDNIEGIGPKRKASLIRHFGTLDEIRIAGIEDLKKVRSITVREARAIYDYFNRV